LLKPLKDDQGNSPGDRKDSKGTSQENFDTSRDGNTGTFNRQNLSNSDQNSSSIQSKEGFFGKVKGMYDAMVSKND
jgi:hypothetical protein